VITGEWDYHPPQPKQGLLKWLAHVGLL